MPRGRGPQQNAGAAEASGDVYCFLHAAARIEAGAAEAIRGALRDPAVAGSNFRMVFSRRPHDQFLAAFYHVLRQLRMFYGDSAIFYRAATFEAAGDFPPHPIMEDLAFVHRLYRQGWLSYLPLRMSTSSRRWEHGGLRQAWASWLVIQLLYFLRVPPARLAVLYRHIR